MVPAIVGYENQDKISINNGAIQELSVPVVEHKFYARSNQSDTPRLVSINIRRGYPICLRIKPNKLVILKSLIIPWYWFSNAFDLIQEDKCKQIEDLDIHSTTISR